MKKILLFFIGVSFACMLQAQVTKTIVCTAGNFYSLLTSEEKSTVTNLIITGTMQETDFVGIRYDCNALQTLDLSGVTILSYYESVGSITYPANELPPNALRGLNNLETLILPSTITSIGESAFYNCNGLTSITIPSSVTAIGNEAFANCSSIASITIPSNVSSIGNSVFENCTNLSSVSIPNSVTSIGEGAFKYCNKLTSISLPTSIKSLSNNLFAGSGLTSITIPSSVTSIGNYTFAYCYSLSSVSIPSSVTSLGNYTFQYCLGLTAIPILSSVTSLPKGIFNGCSGFTSITIPSNITSVGDSAFAQCTGLTSVTIPTSVKTIGSSAFRESALTSVTIPSSVISVGEYAFADCHTLKSASISSSLTAIEAGLFYYCYNLATVSIPSSVTYIGDMAFAYCNKATTITVPPNTKYIGKQAFFGCYTTSQTIPASVTHIGIQAFVGCGLFTVNANNLNYSSLNGILFNKTQDTLVQYPSSLTASSYTIPSTVISIGAYAFDNCSNLKTLSIPSTVTSIGNNAFAYCNGLTSISIPSSVVSIGDAAFENCHLLALVTLPPTLKIISKQLFEECWALTSVSIPSTVDSIGDYAFIRCSGLTSIYAYQNTPVDLSLSQSVFYNVQTSTCILYVPYGSKSLYASASQWSDFTNIVEMNGFILSENTKTIANDANSTASVTITANVTWTASSNQTWLTVNPSIATKGNATLLFTATANTGAARTAIVTVSATGVPSQTITITQEKIIPTLSISATTADVAKDANSISSVAITSNTIWQAVSNQTWLTVSPSVATTGNATLLFTATANPNITTRTATITVSATDVPSKTITVTQAAANPIVLLSQSSYNAAKIAGSISVKVTSNTTWSLSFDKTWGTLNSPNPTTGNGEIIISYSQNPTIASRTLLVTVSASDVNNQTITLIQAPGDTTLSISATTINIAKTANSTSSVDVTSNTSWTASSNQSWLTVNPQTAITGNAKLTFTTQANTAITARTATVTISAAGVTDKIITVIQAAGDPTVSVSATAITIAKDENSTSSVDIASNTSWTANSNQLWLTIDPNNTITGNATLTFTAQANATITTRTAMVTISAGGVTDKTITVTQTAGDPTVSVSATTIDIAKAANSSSSVDITSNTSWTANSNQSWLTVNPQTTTGNATLTFTAQTNTTIAARTATVTISAAGVTDRIISITQEKGDTIFNVPISSIKLSKEANSTATISIEANVSWTIITNALWLDIKPSSGINNGNIIITANENNTSNERIATITITASGNKTRIITVTQTAELANVTVSSNTITVDKNASSTATVNIFSNTSWNINNTASWLTINKTKGIGNEILTFTIQANTTDVSRTATITISATGVADQIITVIQAAGTITFDSEIDDNKDFIIYPNPAKTNFNITITEPVNVDLYSINGELVYRKFITENELITVNNLTKGIYIVKIQTQNEQVIRRLILE